MPDPSLEDELFGAAGVAAAPAQQKSLEDELFEAAGVAAPAPSQEDADVQHARELVAGQPTQLGGGVPLQTPFAEKPWYEKFSDVAAPFTSYLQNVGDTAIAGTSDEVASAILNPPDQTEYGPTQPEDPNTYAAGSRFEDNRQALEADKHQRDKENPVPAAMGRFTGAAAQGAMLPGAAWGVGTGSRLAGAGAAAATGAGLTGAQLLGEGSGDFAHRADQAVDEIQQHPYATGAGVAVPALGAAVGRPAAKAIQGGLEDLAGHNTVAAFTTTAQRAALAENSSKGIDAVAHLGKDVRKLGLHKQPWYKSFRPANAETYYRNARDMRKNVAGPGMAAAENKIVQVADPAIDTGSIADDLEAGADDVSRMRDKRRAQKEAGFMREQAADLAPTKPIEGPVTAQYTEEPQPFFSGGESREYTPTPQELARFEKQNQSYQKAVTPPTPPEVVKFEGPWTPEVPATPGQDVAPQDWYKYLTEIQELPPGAPIPPAPQAVPPTPGVPSKGPGEIYPSRAEIESYNTKLDRSLENRSKLTPPRKPEPGVFEGPEQPSKLSWTEDPPQTYRERTMPFSEGLENRRYYDEGVEHSRRGGPESSPMEEKIRRRIANQLRGKIDDGLEGAVQRGEVPSDLANEWRTHKKNYATASAVEDPALAAMEKDYAGKSPLGLKDAAILSTFGPAASMGDKAMAGRWPSFKANQQARMAGVAESIGADKSAGTLSNAFREESAPKAPNPEEQKQKNESVKEKMHDAMSTGWDWAKTLIGVK